jgi:predicted Zn-dependent protease with MMP-like domain
MLPAAARTEFDELFDRVIDRLPAEVKKLLEETPVVVEDEPSGEILEEVGIDPKAGDADLCGLHSAIPLNQRSVFETPLIPGQIFLFRGPIYRIARGSRAILHKQIEITLLHELGHHFGFNHDKLRAMGYA